MVGTIVNRVGAVVVLVCLLAASAWSATYRVLYNFSSTPSSGLIVDSQGNAYGTTSGGSNNAGTVYEMSPATGYHLLYRFSQKGAGGWYPQGNLVFDSAGNLYGTTVYGGANAKVCGNEGCGVVFELSSSSNGGQWTETVLYSFCSQASCSDGANPHAGVIFDSAGNLYGTTEVGGIAANCCGTVFQLSPSQSGYTENVIYSFTYPNDGRLPLAGLIFDASGNLYGTTGSGGQTGNGTVFELSPAGGGWAESLLYSFGSHHDGVTPEAGLTFDSAGSLYGTTGGGGATGDYGTVFELSPNGSGGWIETILHSFAGGSDGYKPMAGVVFDSSGSLYGTTIYGGATDCNGYGCGTVFKLTLRGTQWTESLFRFPTSGSLGNWPSTPIALDSLSNVYGTTGSGGSNSDGIMFKIAQ